LQDQHVKQTILIVKRGFHLVIRFQNEFRGPGAEGLAKSAGSIHSLLGRIIRQAIKFLQFRIYGYMEWGDDEPTLPEQIRFACYEKEHVSLKYASLLLPFDGETHGTPSDPIELNF
jgi:hypothetical protein